MSKTYVSRQFGWNPNERAWQEIEVYWEDGFIHDVEWLEDGCFIGRFDKCLWIETSLIEIDEAGQRTVRSRRRERQRCYVLAEKVCGEKVVEIWSENAEIDGATNQVWDGDLDIWQDVDGI